MVLNNITAVDLFVKQEKRKKCSNLPNGLVEGEEEEEEDGHGGPELQRTGRWGITERAVLLLKVNPGTSKRV